MMNSRQARVSRKRRTFRKFKKLCQLCHQRPAVSVRKFSVKKNGTVRLGRRAVVKARKGGICGECNRSLMQSILAKQLVGISA